MIARVAGIEQAGVDRSMSQKFKLARFWGIDNH